MLIVSINTRTFLCFSASTNATEWSHCI